MLLIILTFLPNSDQCAFQSTTQRSEAWRNDRKEIIQAFLKVLEDFGLLKFSNLFPVLEKDAEQEQDLHFIAKETPVPKKEMLQSNIRFQKKKRRRIQTEINVTASVSVLKNKSLVVMSG